jgi:hypothetical protein
MSNYFRRLGDDDEELTKKWRWKEMRLGDRNPAICWEPCEMLPAKLQFDHSLALHHLNVDRLLAPNRELARMLTAMLENWLRVVIVQVYVDHLLEQNLMDGKVDL